MRPDADLVEIRDAYRRLARVHHPDARGGRPSSEMAAINEAWRVLSDPARRLDHDRELRADRAQAGPTAGRSTVGSQPAPEPRLSPFGRSVDPPRFPWRFVLVVAILGTAAVLLAGALADPGDPGPVDNVLRPGSCVVVEPSLRLVSEVPCSDPHDAVVRALVPIDGRCALGQEAYLDRQGMGTACVEQLGT